MNLTSKEIAPMMNISYRGVELHRYRLRKKVAIIPRGKPIQVFIINIKLSIFYIYIFLDICNRITIHQYYIIVVYKEIF
jgi:hypothetical protein